MKLFGNTFNMNTLNSDSAVRRYVQWQQMFSYDLENGVDVEENVIVLFCPIAEVYGIKMSSLLKAIQQP